MTKIFTNSITDQWVYFLANLNKNSNTHPVRPRSYWYKYKSGYPCIGYSKHEFACISIAAEHNNMGSETSYLEMQAVFAQVPLYSPRKQQKRMLESFSVNNYVSVMAHVT